MLCCYQVYCWLFTFNNLEDPPYVPGADPVTRSCDVLNELVPENPNKPYDMLEVIYPIVDDGEFLQVMR